MLDITWCPNSDISTYKQHLRTLQMAAISSVNNNDKKKKLYNEALKRRTTD